MKKIVKSLRFYWNQLIDAGKTRIIAVDFAEESIRALEFHPQSKTFSKLTNPLSHHQDDLLIASLSSSQLFHGKIEGLPLSFSKQLFHRKERIEGQIAQKVLWDLTPYSYVYEFRNCNAKKIDLLFTLTSKDHLKECREEWNQKNISPSIVSTPFTALKHYIEFAEIPLPCTILLKRDNQIEKYEFETAQEVLFSPLEEIDLFSLGSQREDRAESRSFLLSNFASPMFESDLCDPDLFLKGLCLVSQSPLEKWSSDPWLQKLSAFLPLALPPGMSFKKAVYGCLALVASVSLVRFVSFYHDLRQLDDDLPFWQVADEQVYLEKDYRALQRIAVENQSMKEALYQKSVEQINALAHDLYPLSIEIDQKEMKIVFATLDQHEIQDKLKSDLMKKVDHLHGSILRDDQKVFVISFPLGNP